MEKVVLNFLDGAKKEMDLVTHFILNGKKIILFLTGIQDGQYKVVGVSEEKDGLFQFIDDQVEWDAIKAALVDILRDRMNEANYCSVKEINVSNNFKKDLSLKDHNLDKLIEEYTKFLNKNNIVTNKPEEMTTIMDVNLNNVNPAPIPQSDIVAQQTPIMDVPLIPPEAVVSQPLPQAPLDGLDAAPSMDAINTISTPANAFENNGLVNESPVTQVPVYPKPEVSAAQTATPVRDSYLMQADKLGADIDAIAKKTIDTFTEMVYNTAAIFKADLERNKEEMEAKLKEVNTYSDLLLKQHEEMQQRTQQIPVVNPQAYTQVTSMPQYGQPIPQDTVGYVNQPYGGMQNMMNFSNQQPVQAQDMIYNRAA